VEVVAFVMERSAAGTTSTSAGGSLVLSLVSTSVVLESTVAVLLVGPTAIASTVMVIVTESPEAMSPRSATTTPAFSVTVPAGEALPLTKSVPSGSESVVKTSSAVLGPLFVTVMV